MVAYIALVVEKDVLGLPILTTALAHAGFNVLSALDSGDGLLLLKNSKDRIDLLFADVDSSGPTDGLALAHAAYARWPTIAIVVSSDRLVPRPASLPPNTLFVPKPFAVKDFVYFAERAIARTGRAPKYRC